MCFSIFVCRPKWLEYFFYVKKTCVSVTMTLSNHLMRASKPLSQLCLFACTSFLIQRSSVQADDAADERREEPAAAAGGDGSDGEEQLTAVLVPPHRVSVMWTAWVFFKTFFSSLIPDVPQGVANWRPPRRGRGRVGGGEGPATAVAKRNSTGVNGWSLHRRHISNLKSVKLKPKSAEIVNQGV